MISIRMLRAEELGHLRELDVTETGTFVYERANGRLVEKPHRWSRPPMTDDYAEHLAAERRETLAKGGVALGAFDGDTLVGVAVLVPRLTETMAQLEYLHVSRTYRRRGIARRLVTMIADLAREHGARTLYVSATPSLSAVSFYQSFGFTPTNDPHPDLLALEPEDIHMTMPL